MGKLTRKSDQWDVLSKSDWSEILELAEKKTFQRKFQIVEAFLHLVASQGLHEITQDKIARRCGIARQLVDHHFRDRTRLIELTYRFVYARFQKAGADGILSREGITQQLDGYIRALVQWTKTHPNDVRFLVQFWAVVQVEKRFSELHERNVQIGQERILVLCLKAQSEGLIAAISKSALQARVLSVQQLIGGFIAFVAGREPAKIDYEASKKELVRSVLALLQLKAPES